LPLMAKRQKLHRSRGERRAARRLRRSRSSDEPGAPAHKNDQQHTSRNSEPALSMIGWSNGVAATQKRVRNRRTARRSILPALEDVDGCLLAQRQFLCACLRATGCGKRRDARGKRPPRRAPFVYIAAGVCGDGRSVVWCIILAGREGPPYAGIIGVCARCERCHTGSCACALIAREAPRDNREGHRDDERCPCQGDKRHVHSRLPHRSLNSTDTSTTTSTGVPFSRAGENRHCRTA
jgi:hypothetical protein